MAHCHRCIFRFYIQEYKEYGCISHVINPKTGKTDGSCRDFMNHNKFRNMVKDDNGVWIITESQK